MSASTRAVHGVLAVAVVMAVSSCQPEPRPVSPSPTQSNSSPSASGSTPVTSSSGSDSSTAGAPGDLLPDLVMLPLEAFHVAFEGNRKVLRFGSDVVNAGDGPLDLTGSRPNVQQPELKVVQNIFQTGGGQRPAQTDAVMKYASADGHDHFHVLNFEQFRLRPADGSDWRASHKEGFCLRDDGNLQGKPSRYDDANFDCGEEAADAALEVRQGLSEGWVDVYDWYVYGQFIDLEGLQLPGDFCIEATADPDKLLVEKAKDNNVASTLLHISATDVSIVRQGC